MYYLFKTSGALPNFQTLD